MFHLLRRIRFAWMWAVAMLIWRNREAIVRTLRSLYSRIRGVPAPAEPALRSVGPTGKV
jgi:hypothetical protein